MKKDLRYVFGSTGYVFARRATTELINQFQDSFEF